MRCDVVYKMQSRVRVRRRLLSVSLRVPSGWSINPNKLAISLSACHLMCAACTHTDGLHRQTSDTNRQPNARCVQQQRALRCCRLTVKKALLCSPCLPPPRAPERVMGFQVEVMPLSAISLPGSTPTYIRIYVDRCLSIYVHRCPSPFPSIPLMNVKNTSFGCSNMRACQ
jgi:hypothetical protein